MAATPARCNCACSRPLSRSPPRNSTLVLPFPVELFRFLERATPPEIAASSEDAALPEADRPTETAAPSEIDRSNEAAALPEIDQPGETAALPEAEPAVSRSIPAPSADLSISPPDQHLPDPHVLDRTAPGGAQAER